MTILEIEGKIILPLEERPIPNKIKETFETVNNSNLSNYIIMKSRSEQRMKLYFFAL